MSNQLRIREDPAKVELVLPNLPEYIALARYGVSFMANTANFNIDEIEDIRVAISEACTNAIQYGCTKCDHYYDYEKVKEPIIGEQVGGFGLFLIKSLMDNLEVNSIIGQGTTLKLQKILGSQNGTEKPTHETRN